MIDKNSAVWKAARKLYHLTPVYKLKERRQMKEAAEIQRLRDAIHETLLHEVFEDKYEIRNGLFKGMKYIREAKCSALLPKFSGSYEEPIQKWVEKSFGRYKKILNVGCAEGYYAVGYAMRDKNAEIIAYDIDASALELARDLAALNNVTDRIEFKGLCTHDELAQHCRESGTLVFCDIEGAETELLDPEKVHSLNNADLLVEAHDCFIPGITETLISRFQKSHQIEIIVDHPRLKDYSNIAGKKLDDETVQKLTDEYRPDGMRFLMMRSLEWMK